MWYLLLAALYVYCCVFIQQIHVAVESKTKKKKKNKITTSRRFLLLIAGYTLDIFHDRFFHDRFFCFWFLNQNVAGVLFRMNIGFQNQKANNQQKTKPPTLFNNWRKIVNGQHLSFTILKYVSGGTVQIRWKINSLSFHYWNPSIWSQWPLGLMKSS